MSSVNPGQPDVNPFLVSADTTNMQAGAPDSFLTRAQFFGQAAIYSGFASIYNTAADYLGAEKYDVAKALDDNDADLGAYYRQNKSAIDTAGFIATSLIPGGLALKGLQLAKAGYMGASFARVAGFASTKSQFYLNQGLKELAVEGGSVFHLINKNKLAAMTWATADQVMGVAAFETAVAATMKQSPLMEADSWADVGKHIALTSLAFGGIGGTIESIALNSIFKKATKTIDSAMREFDTLRKVQGDIPLGDQAYGLLSSMLQLPTVGRNIEFTYRLAGKENSLELPTRETLERALTSTKRRAWEDFNILSNKLAQSDPELGQQFSGYVRKLVDDGLQQGQDSGAIIERLQDHLLNVGKVSRVSEKSAQGFDDIFYVADKIPLEKLPAIKDFANLMDALKNRAPTGNDVTKYPYRIVGNGMPKLGLVGLRSEAPEGIGFARYPNIEGAFDEGVDAAVLANGTIRVNPKSKIIVKATDPIVAPRSFFNVRTGAFTDVAFPTVADIASTTKPLAFTAVNHLVSGGRNWIFNPLDYFRISEIDSLDASARYAYAQNLKVVPQKIRDTDIPLLSRIYQDGAQNWKGRILLSADGSERRIEDIPDFAAWFKDQKLIILQARLNEGAEDVTSLGVKLNVEPDWIQRAISHNFTGGEALDAGVHIPLEHSLKPQNMEIQWDFSKSVEISNELAGKKGEDAAKADRMVQVLPAAAGARIYGELGFQYRVQTAQQMMKDSFTAVVGADIAARFPDLNPEVATRIADQLGAGAGLLKFSNADYGDPLRLLVQHSGQQVNIIAKDWANATLSRLQPLMLKIKDDPNAAAELGVLTTALRRTPEKFTFNPANGKQLVNIETLVKNEDGELAFSAERAKELQAANRRASFEINSDDVAEFMMEHTGANSSRIDKMKVLMTSRGWNYNYDPKVIYAPAVDTSRYPYFAFVRRREGTFNGSSEVSMITARSEAELQTLARKVPEDYEVVFKQNTEKFHKAQGDYDYALTLKEPTIDSTLQRKGILGDFFPETRAENVLDDYINFHSRQETSLIRRAVETRYAQTFEEIRSIGRQFEEVSTSKFGGILKKFKSQAENPFEDYLKTALDISKRSEYTLLHEANEFAEALGTSAYRAFGANLQKAMEGSVSWEEANRISSRYGLGTPYSDQATYFTANTPADKNIVRSFVSKANMFLVNFTLRLDLANSLVNIISTPILLSTELSSIKSLVANDSALAGKLAELRSLQVPGEQLRVPSTVGLIAGAVKNFWGPEKSVLLDRYKSVGAIQTMLSQYHDMVEAFSYKPYEKLSALAEKANKGIEIGAKFSANEWAEEFTRFVSADVMRQLTDPIVKAGKLSLAEQDAYISVFVNRVQGNYLASQRPIAFQGVLGSAISLFQTYQFNLLQQLFRHIENRDTRALATLGGLQSGLYGLNGIPFFEAINTHLIGNSPLNPSHKDVYSEVPQLATKQLGDWMMYGTASAFPLFSSKSPSLYTRGDINPRHVSIIPISPLDVPAVDGSIRFVKNLVDMGSKLTGGASIPAALLEGLEHNGISRPLAGIAQVAQGYATTSKGSLISAANDFSAIATMSRVIGAKPMDESLALNSLFRLNAYQAADAARIQDLGEVVKTKLRRNEVPTPDELHKFQLEYAKAGGRIENYSKTIQRWSRDANVSTVNLLLQQHRSSYSKRMMEILGGDTIQDFRTGISTTNLTTEEAASAARLEQQQ